MAGAQKIVDIAAGRPTTLLSPLVSGYVGYRYAGFAPGIHLGLPSPHLTLVISLDAPVRVAVDAGHPPDGFAALAGGLHTRPAIIAHDGTQHGIQFGLTPAGARALLGVPAGALTGTVVELRDVFGRHADLLAERLAETPDWPTRFALLDRTLLHRATHAARPADPHVARAWSSIVDTGGRVRIDDVARDLGWSRRHLGQRFRDEHGLTPKQAARVARFSASQRLLRRADPPTLATVAATCGYYDQAHLAREWNELAGCPPSAWLTADDLPRPESAGVGRESPRREGYRRGRVGV